MISKESNKQPQLYGLVLAGGKSVRMGHDKSIIKWHGPKQRYYMADLLKSVCTNVFISCRPEQQDEIDPKYPVIPDSYTGSGPMTGILSAFKAYPDAAWLVTACDLPLLDTATLEYLIDNRDANGIATTFESPFDALPEPLITIWEPAGYEVLLSFLANDFTCPRKVLIRNSERVNMLKAPNPDALTNANTPEDAEKVMKYMVLNKIVSIPTLFQSENKSVYTLLKESGYYQFPNEIDEAAVKQIIHQYPQIIEMWIQWSENKRTSSGWYICNRSVAFLSNGVTIKEQIFSDVETACAYFIKTEVEHIREQSYIYDAKKKAEGK